MTRIVSFLVPTYNAEHDLARCLGAVAALDVPAGVQVEVLVADGGSTDATRAVAAAHGARVLTNPRRLAEDGKRVAFDASRGELVVFLDADNVLASADWLRRILAPLADDTVDCVESNYLPAPDFSSFDRYVTRLVVADPVARLLASRPERTATEGAGCSVKVYARGSVPVAGANGFVWRRRLIERYADDPEQLNEVTLLRRLTADRPARIANVAGVGIHHYYTETLTDFVRKRTKIAGKHLARRRASGGDTWVEARGGLRLAAAALYCASVAGPATEALWQATRSRDAAWLWHPVASLATVAVYARAYAGNRCAARTLRR
jgi:glycosyltransferase involved in cell wall biosynthesis